MQVRYLIAFVFALLIGAAWWTINRDESVDADQRVPLPTPAPPQVRPLGGAGGSGWGWVNPTPRAMPTWNDVEVGQGVAVMVGHGGKAARFDGSSLRMLRTGASATLRSVAFLGPTQTIVVGDGGTIVVLLESGARPITSPVQSTLRAVAATGPASALVAGDEGVLMRLDELHPAVVETGRSEDLLAIRATPERTWVVGERGIVLRVEGDQVHVERESRGPTLRAVGGCAGALYAGGDDGQVLRRTSEGRWRRLFVEGEDDWTDVSCDRGRVAFSGSRGRVLLVSGDDTVALESGRTRALSGIGAAGGQSSFIVGEQGSFLRLEEDHLSPLTRGPTVNVMGLESLGGALVGVGTDGRVLRWQEGRIVEVESGTQDAFSALAKVDEASLVAVGDGGMIRRITWDRIDEGTSVGDVALRDVLVGDGTLLAVGTRGRIVSGPVGGPYNVTRAPSEGTLWTLAGTPASAILAGDGGVVLERREGSLRPLPCGERTFRGALQREGVTWLVGDEGVIARVASSRCEVVRNGGPSLYAIGLGPDGALLAVGEGGAALRREGDGWVSVSLGASGVALFTMLRTSRELYIGGAGGAILRHRL